jgi:hypothetical protein
MSELELTDNKSSLTDFQQQWADPGKYKEACYGMDELDCPRGFRLASGARPSVRSVMQG